MEPFEKEYHVETFPFGECHALKKGSSFPLGRQPPKGQWVLGRPFKGSFITSSSQSHSSPHKNSYAASSWLVLLRNYCWLKVQFVISFGIVKGCSYLSSTANRITLRASVPLKLGVDWLGLFMTHSEPLCLFPIYRVRTVCEHLGIYRVRTVCEHLSIYEHEHWTDR